MQDLYLLAIKRIDKRGLATNLLALMLTSGVKTFIFPQSKGQHKQAKTTSCQPAEDDVDYMHIKPPSSRTQMDRSKHVAANLLELLLITGT